MSSFLIYKSSAGSGKTTALVGIFLRLILSQPSPDHFRKLLAITFTNKATNEMKERLLHEMQKISNLPVGYTGGDFMVDDLIAHTGIDAGELRKRATSAFTRMLFDYGDLSISTIDSFNHRLIRSFSRELDLRPDFQIELDAANFFSEAVARVLERVGSDEQLTAHLIAYIAQEQEEERRANVVKKLEGLRGLVMDESSEVAMEALSGIEEGFFQRLSAKLKAETKAFEKELIQLGRDAMKTVNEVGAQLGDFANKGNSWIPLFEQWASGQWGKLEISATRRKIVGGDWHHKQAKAGVRSAIEAATPALNAFAEKALQLIDAGKPRYLLQQQLLKNVHLMAVLVDLRDSLAEIREERNIVPIAYFNRIVSSSLRYEPVAYIYENLGARYDHILIDEFQDTSTLQWLNLLPLVEESVARGMTSLVVGDAKQSIYRWRGGKAEQLIGLPDIDDPEGRISPVLQESIRNAHEIIALNTNYRSAGRVIDFNNRIFAALSPQLCGPGSLYEQEYASVAQHIPNHREGRGYVEVNYLGKAAPWELQLELLSQQIANLHQRGIAYGDICILVRKKAHGVAVASMLAAQGIAVSSPDSLSIELDPAVKLLIAMLRLHADPLHNPSKVSAMRSLCHIHGWPFRPSEYLRKESSKTGIDLNAFLRKCSLPLPRKAWYEHGAYQACETMLRQYIPGEYANAAAMALLNYAMARGGMKLTVSDFLRHWDAPGDKPAAGSSESSNSVQLMTIHKAKGLQFKVCIVPFLNWIDKAGSDEQWIAIDEDVAPDLPYAPIPISGKVKEMGLQEVFEKDDAAVKFDNLNLIYVALTRAVDELYITYTTSKSNFLGAPFHAAMERLSAGMESDEMVSIKHPADVEAYAALQFESDAQCFRYGEPVPALSKSTEALQEGEVLQAAPPASVDWFERFPFAYGAESLGRDVSRKLGIFFHRVAAETASLEEARQWIKTRHRNAQLDAQEQQLLEVMAETLYSDAQYSAFLAMKAERYAERDLVYNGEVLRPDLVFVGAEHTIVIDFKTGNAKESHREQLLRYTEALRATGTATVKAYLLYLEPLKWQIVSIL